MAGRWASDMGQPQLAGKRTSGQHGMTALKPHHVLFIARQVGPTPPGTLLEHPYDDSTNGD